jgi:biopolymer transport protein TolQ
MRLARTLAAFAAILFLAFALPAAAQRGPVAAPVGPAAESQQLGAPQGAQIAEAGATMGAPADGFSIVAMIERADWVVRAVMALLLIASLWSWGIIFNKIGLMSGLKRKARRFEKVFWSGQSLDELYQQFSSRGDHPLAAMFLAALREWRRAFEAGTPKESQVAGIKDRIDKAMSVTIMRETDGIEKHLGILATIGSVSPFIGLFGTVWGIMNSFSAIAARHDTTLAVVAPGIAEALFATAMGLVAAIPAVIFYNRFVAEIGRYVNSLDAFADEFASILSRQLDEKVK